MNNQNKMKDFFKKNGASIVICSSIAVLLVATLYFSFNSISLKEYPENLVAENESILFESVNQSDVKSYKENDTDNTTNDTTTSKVNTTEDTENKEDSSEKETDDTKTSEKQENSENAEDAKETSTLTEDVTFSLFDDTKEMTWPVFGQIVMDYSIETSVYDKTLEQYRTNDSISISAEEGTEVLAAAEGVVERVYADVEDGNTVVINHGNGWLSTYSQLQDNVLVAVGQVVSEGEVIGAVGAPSNYSAQLGSHLDFKITKDNISTDPKVVLAQIEE